MTEITFLLLMLLAIAVLLRLDFVFYLVYVLVGAFVLSRWWTGRTMSRLRLKRHFTDHVFLGETISVDIEIANASWWPVPWLRCDETPPLELLGAGTISRVIAVRPKERIHLRYELVGWRRGYYTLGPARLSTGDLFGFAENQGRVEETEHLVVYPRVIPLAQVALTSRSPHGTIKSRQHIFADPTRIIGVRDYQRGDPPHSIDWKSSARTGRLEVKKHEPAVSLTSVIFLDLNAKAYTRQLRYSASEWGIVVAASLANYLVGQRQAVGLASNGLDSLTETKSWVIPPHTGRSHLMKLLEWLARVQVTEATPLADWLSTATLGLAWGTTVIAITPNGDEATCRALHRLVRAGLNPILVVSEPYMHFSVVRERARRLGVPAHLVANERDLTRWRTTQYRKAVV